MSRYYMRCQLGIILLAFAYLSLIHLDKCGKFIYLIIVLLCPQAVREERQVLGLRPGDPSQRAGDEDTGGAVLPRQLLHLRRLPAQAGGRRQVQRHERVRCV